MDFGSDGLSRATILLPGDGIAVSFAGAGAFSFLHMDSCSADSKFANSPI